MTNPPSTDDVVKVDPKAIRIIAINKKTGERIEVTKRLYWFEENGVTMFKDWLWDFEITLHDPTH